MAENNTEIKEDKRDLAQVSFAVFEGMVERYEAREKRMAERHAECEKRSFKEKILLISLIVLSNFAWLFFTYQYDFISYEQDGTGVNIIGNTNEVQQYEPTTEKENAEER